MPKEILGDVLWSFVGGRFADRAAFDAAVRQYQIDIRSKDTWRPSEVVIPGSKLRLVYECWEGDKQIEPVIELSSDSGASFTASELLFKIHNAVVEQLRGMDHHFFEGLVPHSRQIADQPPLYELNLGS
jgi:hypothetical protein